MQLRPNEFDTGIEIVGNLKITLRDARGRFKTTRHIKNLVVTAGKGLIADRMKTTPSIGPITHMAVGSGATAASLSDTALGTQISSRVGLTVSGGAVSGAVITYLCTFGAGVSTGSITEAGLFTASSGGTMLARTVFSVITKAAGDSLAVTWTVTIS